MVGINKHSDVWECDGCGSKFVTAKGEVPDGYHGTVCQAGDWGGGPSAKWFACDRLHVQRAVNAVLDRQERD